MEEMTSTAQVTPKQTIVDPVLMGQTYSMKNLSEEKSGIENTLKELRKIISHISNVIEHASEILSQFKEMTSGTEVIEPSIFSIPDVMIKIPGQANGRDKEINEGNSEPKQATTITY